MRKYCEGDMTIIEVRITHLLRAQFCFRGHDYSC